MSADIKVIDLFCGIGGLSHGLIKAGLDVVAGIDNDIYCKYGYEYNNARFINKDVINVSGEEINALFGDGEKVVRVLVGCAPCKPYSGLNLKRSNIKQKEPLGQFASLIVETLPDIVSMENVGALANTEKYPIYRTFVDELEKNGYKYSAEIVNAAEYGVPQNRKRLVLLASRFGDIELVNRTHKNNPVSVRKAIYHLEPIKAGEVSKTDILHRARRLNATNLKRIRSTPHDGGSPCDWDDSLVLECHKRYSGKSFKCTVYGRMRWDKPAPTMTTHCVGLGSGRFGHPEQDRAISLREAAIFQTFPKTYVFSAPDERFVPARIAKFIGNAVPVRLGVIIGRSIKKHVEGYVQ